MFFECENATIKSKMVRIFRIWTEYRDLVMMQIQKKMKILKDNM